LFKFSVDAWSHHAILLFQMTVETFIFSSFKVHKMKVSGEDHSIRLYV